MHKKLMVESLLRREGFYLPSMDLSHLELTAITLTHCRFDGSNLRASKLLGNTFIDVNFDECDMQSVNFEGSTFRNCSFVDTLLTASGFYRCQFSNCTFAGAGLGKTSFQDASLVTVDFTDADMSTTIFTKIDNLTMVKLSPPNRFHPAACGLWFSNKENLSFRGIYYPKKVWRTFEDTVIRALGIDLDYWRINKEHILEEKTNDASQSYDSPYSISSGT